MSQQQRAIASFSKEVLVRYVEQMAGLDLMGRTQRQLVFLEQDFKHEAASRELDAAMQAEATAREAYFALAREPVDYTNPRQGLKHLDKRDQAKQTWDAAKKRVDKAFHRIDKAAATTV